MGITDLWLLLAPATAKRVPFPLFLAHFLAQHRRPPRLAIDAYMFLFWSLLPSLEPLDGPAQRRILRNFMAKLWYLVQNNVSFVVVFDGRYKPGKLRHGHIPEMPEALSYDDALRHFATVPAAQYGERNGLVELLKAILLRNRLDWVQAPAEAEAECAWLLRLGVVDYVVSDDSDTLVFGATHVLRMFNRVKCVDDGVPVLSSTDYYVTPVTMLNVARVTGLTRDRLVFVAALRGGDYSSGAEGIGITRASELALCGTTVLLAAPRKKVQDFGKFPDFAGAFVAALVDADARSAVLLDPHYAMKDELDRAESLAAFTAHLNEFIDAHGGAIFGRATRLARVTIDDYYAMFRAVFRFCPGSVSFAELALVANDLAATVAGRVARANVTVGPGVIGYLSVSETGCQTYEPYYDPAPVIYAFPHERKYNLRPFVLKLLAQHRFWKHIQFARTKPMEDVQLAVLKFKRVALNEAVYLVKSSRNPPIVLADLKGYSSELKETSTHGAGLLVPEKMGAELGKDVENDADELLDDDERILTVVTPLEAVKYVSEQYVREQQPRSPHKSPQKKALTQKTTLDSIWPKLSPQKHAGPRRLDFLPPETLNTRVIVTIDLTQPEAPAEKFQVVDPVPIDGIFARESSQNTGTRPTTVERRKEPPTAHSTRSPSPNVFSALPTKNRARVLPRKHRQTLLPGQSVVTSFFQTTPRLRPSKTPSFNLTETENDCVFKNHRIVGLGPSVDSVNNSPETSPTKRTKPMDFSPETSPIKAKSESASEKDPFFEPNPFFGSPGK
ncbi:PIN domain-like protein [Metschnikowia bicuspidata]|uniref:PIN domain-like protein n=1 Tax=Metschnikowia bicuspidata TaxID=27322 RepID=A0A4V1J3C6_9ASCO|nr:PIN domain-like protein [Metschnikowia bicuspidata]